MFCFHFVAELHFCHVHFSGFRSEEAQFYANLSPETVTEKWALWRSINAEDLRPAFEAMRDKVRDEIEEDEEEDDFVDDDFDEEGTEEDEELGQPQFAYETISEDECHFKNFDDFTDLLKWWTQPLQQAAERKHGLVILTG